MKKKKVFLVIALLMIATGVVTAQTNYTTAGWPPANILRQFGIEGMPQPAGANDVSWRGDWEQISDVASSMYRGNPALRIGFRGTNATGAAIKTWFERNGWKFIEERRGVNFYEKGNATVYYEYTSDNTGQIIAGVIPEIGKNSLLYGTWSNPSNGHTLIFASDGWEWVEWFGGEYIYDGTTLKLTYIDYNTDEEYTTTVTVTISGSTITVGRFSGGAYVDFFNSDLPGRFTKQ